MAHQASNPIKRIVIEMEDGRVFHLDSADVLSTTISQHGGFYGRGYFVLSLDLKADELSMYYGGPMSDDQDALPGSNPLLPGAPDLLTGD